MKFFRTLALAAALAAVFGTVQASAQAFFPSRVKGTVEIKFPASVGQPVQVAIDDQPAGPTPLTVYVLPGTHRFTFTVGTDAPQTMAYPVRQDMVFPSLVTVKTYPLTVNTNVPGAQIAVDGAAIAGNTTQIAAGNHTVTVTAPGYTAQTVPFVQPAGNNVLNIPLAAAAFPLTVNTNVPGAQLALDGVPFAGNTTQAAPGSHTLTISAPGFQTLTLPFSQPAQANVLKVNLVASLFPLTVNTNVPGAQMALDGVPFAGNTTQAAAGNHTLTVTAAGYQTLTAPFVQPGQANILNVTLQASTGTLTLNLDRMPKSAQAYKFYVDNLEVRGFAQALTPGSHLVRVQSGNLSIETVVNIAAGQTQTLTPSVQWELR